MNNMSLPPKEIHNVVDWLMYKSYEHNRNLSPEKPVDSWKKLYMYADLYEGIYQNKKFGGSK